MATLFKLFNLTFICFVIFIFVGCSSSQEKSAVNFTLIANGSNSGYVKKERIIIKNRADFQKMWENLYINFSEKPQLPDVNFSNQMILGVFFGEYTSGGGSIAVKSVDMYDDAVIVNIEEVTPGPNCVTTDVMTQPYQIVRIPKVISPLKFVTIHTVRNCN
jgi:hypothetical protein